MACWPVEAGVAVAAPAVLPALAAADSAVLPAVGAAAPVVLSAVGAVLPGDIALDPASVHLVVPAAEVAVRIAEQMVRRGYSADGQWVNRVEVSVDSPWQALPDVQPICQYGVVHRWAEKPSP